MATNLIYQGITQTIAFQARANTFVGTEVLIGTLFAGVDLVSPALSFTPTWTGGQTGGPLGKVSGTFDGASTAPVWPGVYQALVYTTANAFVLADSVTVAASPLGTFAITFPYTRAMVDRAIFGLVSSPLSAARSPVLVGSPVQQFSVPISRAMAFMKIRPSNPVSPVDADFASVSPDRWQMLIDIAEAEVLNNAVSASSLKAGTKTSERWPDYSYNIDPNAINYAQSLASTKMKFVRAVYGYGVSRMKYGSFDYGSQATWKRCGTPSPEGEF